MKIEEIKDYLTEKKDGLKNYIVDKKENIKDGAKKAISTGLVVSTLLTGAIATTGCEDVNLTPEEKEYNQVLDNIDKKLGSIIKGDYSDVTICKDSITSKYIIIFADNNCKQGSTFEISEDDFNRIKAAAISADNEGLTINENCIFFSKQTLRDDIGLRVLVDSIYNSISDGEKFQYEVDHEKYLAVAYNQEIPVEEWKEFIDECSDCYDYYSGYYKENCSEEEKNFLESHMNANFELNEIEIFRTENDFYRHDIPNSSKPANVLNFVHYIDTDGDGIDDDVDVLHYVFGGGKIEKYVDNTSEALIDTLNNYVDGKNIRCENGVYVLNPKVIGDSKYYLVNELLRSLCRSLDMSGMAIEQRGDEVLSITGYTDYYNFYGREYLINPKEKETHLQYSVSFTDSENEMTK